jgi:integrase
MTLAAYGASWLRDTAPTVKPTTLSFYRAALLHLDDLGNLPVTRITPAHIRDLIAARIDEGYASRTIRGVVQTLALILRRAEGDGLVERNVAALVKLPRLEQKEPGHFTAEQARRFLEVAKDDALYSLYAVALGTGLRRGELLALTWSAVDLGAAHLMVRRGKTAAAVRQVPLPPFAAMALAGMDHGPGPIWNASPTYVSKHFRVLCRRAGVPDLTLHSLRHTTSTLMAEEGVPLEVRRWLLGHSKAEMTSHYTAESEGLKRDAAERLGRLVG